MQELQKSDWNRRSHHRHQLWCESNDGTHRWCAPSSWSCRECTLLLVFFFEDSSTLVALADELAEEDHNSLERLFVVEMRDFGLFVELTIFIAIVPEFGLFTRFRIDLVSDCVVPVVAVPLVVSFLGFDETIVLSDQLRYYVLVQHVEVDLHPANSLASNNLGFHVCILGLMLVLKQCDNPRIVIG